MEKKNIGIITKNINIFQIVEIEKIEIYAKLDV